LVFVKVSFFVSLCIFGLTKSSTFSNEDDPVQSSPVYITRDDDNNDNILADSGGLSTRLSLSLTF